MGAAVGQAAVGQAALGRRPRQRGAAVVRRGRGSRTSAEADRRPNRRGANGPAEAR